MGKSTESNLSFQFDSSFVERMKCSLALKQNAECLQMKKRPAVPFAALYPFASFGSELR